MHRLMQLVAAVQGLSLAKTVAAVADIVRVTARALTGADGATFVLRDGDLCYYADEDAIAPLWKGLRFPMSACVSGWVMNQREAVVMPDIYADPRVPIEAYRPTFVRSMAMVPIRRAAPIGAIGNYWATRHTPSSEDVELLQALADSTSIALENVQVYQELERRVADRTAELSAVVKELETFSYSVSHDLRAPLRAVSGFTSILKSELGPNVAERASHCLTRIEHATLQMGAIIDALLELNRVGRSDLQRGRVDVSQLARDIGAALPSAGGAPPELVVHEGLVIDADPRLVRALLGNLLENAWKYSAKSATPRVAFGRVAASDDDRAPFFVEDNGVGFDMSYAHKLFEPFGRLHDPAEFPGSGIGLATAHRIVARHGGQIWAQGEPGRGATFYFTLGA